jgi:hypothetical protein
MLMNNYYDSVPFNVSEEKRILQDNIIKIAVDNGATVFGQCVRNMIIIDYYTELFNSKNANNQQQNPHSFWTNPDKETIQRMVLHDTIDLMFPNKYNFKLFLKDLQNAYISYEKMCDFSIDIGPNNVLKETYEISIKPIRVRRKTVTISSNIDIIVNTELPDMHLDIEMFVYSKNGISLRTGTFINSFDKLGHHTRMSLCPIISNGIIQKKINVLRLNEKSLKKISYFIKEGHEIKNLPFITHGNYGQWQCVICFENNKATVKLNNCYLCKDCIHMYLNQVSIIEDDSGRYIKDTNNSKITIYYDYNINTG